MSGDHNMYCSANNKPTRRVRAGGLPPPDLPIDMIEDDQHISDFEAWLIVFALVAAIGLMVWVVVQMMG